MIQHRRQLGSGATTSVSRMCLRLICCGPIVSAFAAAQLRAQQVGASASLIALPSSGTAVAARIDTLFLAILWITSAVLLAVFAWMAIALVRFRASAGRSVRYSEGNTRIEIVWVVLTTLILVGIAMVSRSLWNDMRVPADDSGPFVVEIQPRQYEWDIRYAGTDGAFGTGDDITAINQLRVPAGKTVLLELRSQDVIHSFFVPAFRIKQDAVPGMTTTYTFSVPAAGTFEIACAELCGLGHYRMRGFLSVLDPNEFNSWYGGKCAQRDSVLQSAHNSPRP